MSTALVAHQQEQSVVEFSEEQVDLLKRMVCPPGTTNDELNFFLTYAKRTGLDPFARQIYCMKKRDKFTVESTIDGFRLCAERTGEYEGQEDPVWCGEDGKWYDVWLDQEPPVACRVGVWRKGFKQALRAVALFEAYKQTYWDSQAKAFKLGPQWEKNGANMLAKCFTPDTQVLTADGFQDFGSVAAPILQVTERGLESVDAQPFVQEYSGPMVVAHGDMLNFAVTPNHDMVTTVGKVEARVLFETARTRPMWHIPMTLDASGQDSISISDADLKLAGYIAADGWHNGYQLFTIGVSRDYKIGALKQLQPASHGIVRSAGAIAVAGEREIRTRSDKERFSFDAWRVYPAMDRTKTFSVRFLLSLSKRQARILLNAWQEFDGHTDARSGVRRIYTSRPDHLQVIQILAVIAGFSVGKPKRRQADTGKENYYLTISEPPPLSVVKPTGKQPGVVLESNASGSVWCVTVPSGRIVVRRNGFSMICGNCAEALALRKAFPRELSGLYSSDEMAQAGNPPTDQGMDYEGTREKQQAVAQEKIAQLKAAQAAAAELPASTGTEKPPFDFKNMIENFQKIHAELVALGGQKYADKSYYDILGRYGCCHANEFSNAADAKAAYKDMLAIRRTWEKRPPPKEEAEPFKATDDDLPEGLFDGDGEK